MKDVRSRVEGSKFTVGLRKKFRFHHLKSRNMYFRYALFPVFPINNK